MNRLLNLRPGEFVRGLPLFGYYFLIISSYVMAQVARDALFLDKFTAAELPYVDIASAALVGVVIAFYIRLGRYSGLRNLLVVSLLFFAGNVAVFWWAAHYYRQPWIYQAFYIWVGIFGVLAPTQVWTLANFIWTTREAKRLFGLLGSGGIAGAIVGGFLSNWMASTFGTESILLIVTSFLMMSAALVVIIWGQRATDETGTHQSEESPAGLIDSFKLVRKSTHLQAIAALICLSSIVTTAAGWQLKAVAKETLLQKDVLAAFFGSFQGYTAIGSLLAQLLITTKLLRRFGIGVALLVLPLTLTAGSGAVLIWGTLWAVSLLKGGDKVIRYSIDTSALQLLYLPVPANIKLQVKSFIDTVIWRFGDALAGLTLLVFATNLRFTPRQIGWVNLALLAVWIGAAFVARHQYVLTLRDNIQRVRVHPEQVSVPLLDPFTTNLFAEKLSSRDPNEVLYALSLFEMGQHVRSHSAVRNLLEHPSPHVRQKALSILNSAGDLSVRQQAAALLSDESLDVRTEALEYLTRHDSIDPIANIQRLGDFADSSICSATVAFLARPGEAQNLDAAGMILDGMVREDGEKGVRTRAAAARLIASLPDHFDSHLERLVKDGDAEVVKQAMRSAAMLRKRRFVPVMIDQLGNERLAADATDALTLFDEAIVGTLRDHLNDPQIPIEIRQRIPLVLLRIGTASAAGVLSENLLQGDTVLRFRIISALNKLYDVRRNLTLDRPMIETIMIAELIGHYRSYQIMGMTGGALDERSECKPDRAQPSIDERSECKPDRAQPSIDERSECKPDAKRKRDSAQPQERAQPSIDESLKQSMNDELERIFRLMKLLFPSLDLQNAYLGVQSEDPVTHSNALEFLDNTLNPQLRAMLVPLIDSEVSVQERIQLADRFLGFSLKA